MWIQTALWKYLIRRAARQHGLIDPISFLTRLRSFSQPSEVKEPMTLIRAGIMFQARGAINARAIQFNLDWVWPFWVEKQFNPADQSFIPRGFAPTHINLTQRNWTAVGVPGVPLYPLVDPRGLVTPFFDGWSLDMWLLSQDNRRLLPSKLANVRQWLAFDPHLAVCTAGRSDGLRFDSRVYMTVEKDTPTLKIELSGTCGQQGHLAVAVRPYNPEGIQFINTIECIKNDNALLVDGKGEVRFSRPPNAVHLSNYWDGDVLAFNGDDTRRRIHCDIGMATAAALFSADVDSTSQVTVEVPLDRDLRRHFHKRTVSPQPWSQVLDETATLHLPAGERFASIYEAAKRTLVLLSAEEIYPGPFTYRRFWFRDAVLMANAMLSLNMGERLEAHLVRFPERQKRDGFFESQEGEWDSNGQVLWLIDRWRQCTRRTLGEGLITAVRNGAEWIIHKRIHNPSDPLHDGLLPAGFSAEHLGPNDYYYWDDFWSIAGLQAAARIMTHQGDDRAARKYALEASDFQKAVFSSINAIPEHRRNGGIPASPYRRMDAGAIGSMVADYPLQITPPGDAGIEQTLEFLLTRSSFKGGFFQDMIHSGINIYLTLDLAQTLLRNGDNRFRDLMETVADLASPTGQWPEAVHPFSGGGCMGDGQHGWAAAEWINMVRNLFVREEGSSLIFGTGLLPDWLDADAVSFGPTATPHGIVRFKAYRETEGLMAEIDGQWHNAAPNMRIAVPGHIPVDVVDASRPFLLRSDHRRHTA